VRSARRKERGEPAEVVDIMELLKQSVGEARKRGGTRGSSSSRQRSGARQGGGTRERRAS
jgi:non-homologous end joining protein Ku